MKIKDWEKLLLSPSSSLADAVSILEQERTSGMILVVGEDQELLGTITDGDIRRAIIRRKGMSSSLEEVMNRNPVVAPVGSSWSVIKDLCKEGYVTSLPIVDQRRRVVGLEVVLSPEAYKALMNKSSLH